MAAAGLVVAGLGVDAEVAEEAAVVAGVAAEEGVEADPLLASVAPEAGVDAAPLPAELSLAADLTVEK